jgi:hypothetical protein
MLSSWILPIIMAMSSSATAGVTRVTSATPSYFQKRDCEEFQYNAGSVHLGSWCVTSVGPPRLEVRQTGIGVSGLGCLPQVFFVNGNGEHRTTEPCSVDSQDIDDGTKGFTETLGKDFSCGSLSSISNLDSIQLNGGDDSVMNIIYHFSNGRSYNAQCTGEGIDFCEAGNIGEPITGGLLNCPLPAEAISINGCDECCGDVIQGC